MENKINAVLEDFDSLSIDEQEVVVEIERKRLTERKRTMLVKNVNEAEEEYNSGKLKSESVDEIMKAIENEADKDK